MRRTILNTLGSLLMMASLVWGACASCQQLAYELGSDQSCCDDGVCKRPMGEAPAEQPQPADCQQMPLMHVRAQDSRAEVAATFAGSAPVRVETAAAPVLFVSAGHRRALDLLEVSDASPPDLPIQNVSLLI